MRRIVYCIIFTLLGFLSQELLAQKSFVSEELSYTYEIIETGISIPWSMAFLPNQDMLVSDRSGKIIIVRNGKILSQEIEGVPEVFKRGQGGLFDIKLHPQYHKNGWIYLTYSAESDQKNQPGGMTYVMRAKLKNNILTEKEIIFKGYPFSRSGVHFGGKMEFDNEGYLYFSLGERGEKEKAQQLNTCNGKIFRLHDDGSIPKDNPFVDKPETIKAIFSYGHRNPQGLALNPDTGELWETEHGPMGGDELNIIRKGKNYGWPEITYGTNYDGSIITTDTAKAGMEQPVIYWRPSIAVTNLIFVTSNLYPAWKGNILACGMKFQYLERLVIKNDKVIHKEKITQEIGRIRTVSQSPDGYIYVAVEGGKIYKIIPDH